AKEFKRNSPKETENTAQSKRVKMRKGWRSEGKESAVKLKLLENRERSKLRFGSPHFCRVLFFPPPLRLSLCSSPHITNKLTDIIKQRVF
ncbi:MAG: hypothetical protein IJ368_03335, partial [Oscillospiraceae bacterium]|nr:hypothetical protein [Oscillospiraceae bacterium]